MILIGQYDSPFVRRVAVALQQYGLAYEHRPWSVWADADSIARYNPLRRVPVLVTDDGEPLVESAAILDALDDQVGPERALLPRSGEARRAGLRVCALATGLADKAVSLLYEHVLRTGDRQSPVWVERCTAQIGETLDLLERERAARRGDGWWLGAFSHADIAVGCALRFVGEAHPALVDAARRPALAAHAARCEALPVFAAVVQPLHVAV
ncbi:glutathione S-transferase family protein [Sorangium sp. So ce375]|uniref:glutathione S-transferase family protein n=1 Tax=Sorangium sp. So ce375 TaxID=3133306 RepID=UPI003F5C6580